MDQIKEKLKQILKTLLELTEKVSDLKKMLAINCNQLNEMEKKLTVAVTTLKPNLIKT